MEVANNRAAANYTRSEQVSRVIWMLVGRRLFAGSFRTFFGWRRWVLRRFGASVAPQVNIYPSATIYLPWNLQIGEWSAIGEDALIYNLGKVVIGKQVTISQRAHLCAGTHDYTDPAMPLLKLPITIGDQAWICADAFVGPGVTVGEGAVVGARAVVTKDVAPWTVVVGNPARMVKKRELHS